MLHLDYTFIAVAPASSRLLLTSSGAACVRRTPRANHNSHKGPAFADNSLFVQQSFPVEILVQFAATAVNFGPLHRQDKYFKRCLRKRNKLTLCVARNTNDTLDFFIFFFVIIAEQVDYGSLVCLTARRGRKKKGEQITADFYYFSTGI